MAKQKLQKKNKPHVSRRAKKRQKKALQQQAGKINGQSRKQLEKYTINELNNIISDNARKQQKVERQRQREQEKRDYIQKHGLTGVNARSSWDKLKDAKHEKDLAARRDRYRKQVEERRQILKDKGLLEKDFPKGWQQMSKEKLAAYYPENRDNMVLESDIWLYIGWGDKSGNENVSQRFASDVWYAGLNESELRENIADTMNSYGIDDSSGHAGDTVISYGTYNQTYKYMRFCEQRGYQTIFFGNQLTVHALLRYTAAAIDSSPESNRDFIKGRVNGYLKAIGHSELKI